MAFRRQHGQKGLNLRRTQVARVLHDAISPVPTDEKAHPMQVGFFGLKAIVQKPDALPNLIQQTDGTQNRSAGFHGCLILVYKNSIKNLSS